DEAAKAVAVGDGDQVADDLESEGGDGNPPGATAAVEPQDSRVDGKHGEEKKGDGDPFSERREVGVRARVEDPKPIERSAREEEQKRSKRGHESGEVEEEAEGKEPGGGSRASSHWDVISRHRKPAQQCCR